MSAISFAVIDGVTMPPAFIDPGRPGRFGMGPALPRFMSVVTTSHVFAQSSVSFFASLNTLFQLSTTDAIGSAISPLATLVSFVQESPA
jgi:hypothetical protein